MRADKKQYIRDNYKEMTIQQMADVLKVGWGSVKHFMRREGLDVEKQGYCNEIASYVPEYWNKGLNRITMLKNTK